MNQRSLLFDTVVLNSWWVILYLLLLLFFFDQTKEKRSQEIAQLKAKKNHLFESKKEAEERLEELALREKSQDDPLWIELLLREKLGLVGEQETKVLFR